MTPRMLSKPENPLHLRLERFLCISVSVSSVKRAGRVNETMRRLYYSTPKKPGSGKVYGCSVHAHSKHG